MKRLSTTALVIAAVVLTGCSSSDSGTSFRSTTTIASTILAPTTTTSTTTTVAAATTTPPTGATARSLGDLAPYLVRAGFACEAPGPPAEGSLDSVQSEMLCHLSGATVDIQLLRTHADVEAEASEGRSLGCSLGGLHEYVFVEGGIWGGAADPSGAIAKSDVDAANARLASATGAPLVTKPCSQ